MSAAISCEPACSTTQADSHRIAADNRHSAEYLQPGQEGSAMELESSVPGRMTVRTFKSFLRAVIHVREGPREQDQVRQTCVLVVVIVMADVRLLIEELLRKLHEVGERDGPVT